MKRINLLLLAALAALVVTTSGCVVALGNSGTPKGGGSATMGQQLTDLKKARDAGALSESEYEAQRQKLLCNGKR